MTDERMDEQVDALIRRLDVGASPDPDYAQRTFAMLVPRVHRARSVDRSPAGRVARLLRTRWSVPLTQPALRRTFLVVVVLALLLSIAFALVAVGSRRPSGPISNGPLIISNVAGLQMIPSDAGGPGSILVQGATKGASRSPNGRLVSFWTASGTGDQLNVMNVDGSDRRNVVIGLPLTWNNCIDTWSLDSRWVASEVSVDGLPRILATDTSADTARVLTPVGVIAHCPLWSPDGKSVAFEMVSPEGQRLAVIGIDGGNPRVLTGRDFAVAGADAWSPDGRWIYFVGQNLGFDRIYRVDAIQGGIQVLTPEALRAAAPALSPDGSTIAFIAPNITDYSLYAANADGSSLHLVLADAVNDGWSADGQLILADWRPPNATGGLVTIKPDGTDRTLVYAFPPGCLQTGIQPHCVDSIGWGQARP